MPLNVIAVLQKVFICTAIVGAAFAQGTKPWSPLQKFVPSAVSDRDKGCKFSILQESNEITFRERFCFYESKLISPGTAAHGIALAAFAQFTNRPYVQDQGPEEFGRRVGLFYIRRIGQNGGELFAGYLNHEELVPHASLQHGFWKRSRYAAMAVLTATDDNGKLRPALAPIAGSLGSGMMSAAFYRHSNGLEGGLSRAGFTYGTYFATALVREFEPDLSNFAAHLHRKKRTGRLVAVVRGSQKN